MDDNPIKQLRAKYGVTQMQLSQITKIPKRTIENWEDGQNKPKQYIVDMIEIVLKTQKEGK